MCVQLITEAVINSSGFHCSYLQLNLLAYYRGAVYPFGPILGGLIVIIYNGYFECPCLTVIFSKEKNPLFNFGYIIKVVML